MNPPRTYRKRPVEIQAMQLTRGNAPEVAVWCGGEVVWSSPISRYVVLEIPTLEGTMRCITDDYIICGIKGEFYPCNPDIFEATYEEVKP